MSSWIVAYKTIDRILSHRHFVNIDPKDLTEMGQDMLDLNTNATNARYDVKVDKKRQKDYIKEYKFHRVRFNEAQSLKSLACFLYQCSEDFSDTTKFKTLFKELSELRINWALEIVERNDEYIDAEWG